MAHKEFRICLYSGFLIGSIKWISSSFVLTEMHYVTIYINSSSQKLHKLLRNRISSSRILSMARPSLEAGLMRWVDLRKAGAKLYCIVVCLFDRLLLLLLLMLLLLLLLYCGASSVLWTKFLFRRAPHRLVRPPIPRARQLTARVRLSIHVYKWVYTGEFNAGEPRYRTQDNLHKMGL